LQSIVEKYQNANESHSNFLIELDNEKNEHQDLQDEFSAAEVKLNLL
jgi:hypothetical protein